MKCPNCQTENPEGIRFCGKCGQPLKLELVCPQCGHANPPGNEFCYDCGHSLAEIPPPSVAPPSPEHTSFAGGRYQIKRFLGEGSKKKVYLAHDTLLDRDIAFALLKTEQLDDAARTRITGEAQVMGRLGSYQNVVTVFDLREHEEQPYIVTVFDLGEHEDQPYIVAELMAGGDIEGLIENASEHRLPLEQAIDIAKSVCLGSKSAHSKGVIKCKLM